MENITKKIQLGIFWNSFEKICVRGISFALSIILARLLSPHDYGVIGILTVFSTLSNVFVDSGFTVALVQKQDRTELDCSTMLIFNVAVSCFLYLILFLASPLISQFYKTPELISLQRVFFIVIIFDSLKSIQFAQLQIKMDFKRLSLINTISIIISAIIAVFAAYNGFGVWTLVIQILSSAFVSASLSWIMGKWIPKTGFSFESFKRLFGFGSKILASNLLSTTIDRINNLVIGKTYSSESLGFYTRAQHFPELISGTIFSVFSSVSFPVMSAIQYEREKLIKNFGRLIKMSVCVIFPAMIGISVLSRQIILVLFGEKWLPCAELLFWLALSDVFSSISALNLSFLNAIGRPDLFLKITVIKIPITITTMIVTFPISLKAVVVGKTVTAFLYFYINTFMVGRLYNFGAFKQLAHCRKLIASAITMGIVVAFSTSFFENNLICLISGIVIGVAVYVLLLFLLKEESLGFVIHRIFKREKIL